MGPEGDTLLATRDGLAGSPASRAQAVGVRQSYGLGAEAATPTLFAPANPRCVSSGEELDEAALNTSDATRMLLVGSVNEAALRQVNVRSRPRTRGSRR